MRLFVDKYNHKVWIAASASTRCELAQQLGDKFDLKIDDVLHTFNIDEVCAEPAGDRGPVGMIIGALIGLLGGPIGVILGGLAGGVIGRMEDGTEKRKVTTFNESHIRRDYGTPNT